MSVLITGGAKKLGRVLTLALSKKYPVVMQYRNSKKEAMELQKIANAQIIYGDFSTIEGIHSFVSEYKKRFPNTEILIHNASQYLFGSFSEAPIEKGLMQWNTDFLAGLILARELSSSLKNIIFLGVAGLMQSLSDTRTSFYTLSKLNLLMLTKSLAKELAPKNVRVNMISPGYLEESIDQPKSLPMQRPAKWEEIEDALLFLLENSYITGQNLEVAGGVRL